MTWLWITVAGVWLFMTRLTMRWSVEIEGWDMSIGEILAHLILWPIGFSVMLPEWLKKTRKSPLNERALRLVVGESAWHRRERLAREAAEREKDIRQAEQELGIK